MTARTLPSPLEELEDRYANNDGVSLHYMAGGSGPLVVFLHGFPDFWLTWRHQIAGLLVNHSVAAIDMRGFNLSDAPAGVEQYSMDHLVSDVVSVIRSEGRKSAVVVGHDWGGAVAWQLAIRSPEIVDRLVVVNVPHPAALQAELARPGNRQAAAFGYTAGFRAEGSERSIDIEALAAFRAAGAEDADDLARYREAFERSDPEAMMNYYRQNPADRSGASAGQVSAPVLQFHGLDDPALLVDSVNGTWAHVSSPWTLVTIPGAGHWPHQDQPDLVTGTMLGWLDQPVAVLSRDCGGVAPNGSNTQATDDGSAAGCCT